MIRVLAMKVGSYGVRVNGVAPGPTKTDILEKTSQNIIETLKAKTCMNVILDPQDIANAAVFLASDKARHITGIVLAVDAGSALR